MGRARAPRMRGLGDDRVVALIGEQQRAARVVGAHADARIGERVDAAPTREELVGAQHFRLELDDVDRRDARRHALEREAAAEPDDQHVAQARARGGGQRRQPLRDQFAARPRVRPVDAGFRQTVGAEFLATLSAQQQHRRGAPDCEVCHLGPPTIPRRAATRGAGASGSPGAKSASATAPAQRERRERAPAREDAARSRSASARFIAARRDERAGVAEHRQHGEAREHRTDDRAERVPRVDARARGPRVGGPARQHAHREREGRADRERGRHQDRHREGRVGADVAATAGTEPARQRGAKSSA